MLTIVKQSATSAQPMKTVKQKHKIFFLSDNLQRASVHWYMLSSNTHFNHTVHRSTCSTYQDANEEDDLLERASF